MGGPAVIEPLLRIENLGKRFGGVVASNNITLAVNTPASEGLERPDIQLFTDPQSLRAEYLALVDEFTRTIRDACVDHRIDYVGLSTADSLDVVLRRYLTARASMRK